MISRLFTPRRTKFILAAILLLLIEVLIALYVHDSFIRPYFGDVLVVVLIWCVIRAIFPEKRVFFAPFVLLFAAAVEFSQMIPLVELLGLGSSRFFVTLMGDCFSWGDILCYICGCIPTFLIELWQFGKRSER